MPPAHLAPRGDLDFACSIPDCSYEGEAVNDGPGCGRTVRGVTRLLASDGSDIASDDWALDPERTIQPGEVLIYEGCSFDPGAVSTMGSYDTDIFWENVPCP